MSSIKTETSISLIVVVGILGLIFTAYQIFSPSFEQIKVNKAQLGMHQDILRSLRISQNRANEHLLKISNSLSSIEGRLHKD